MSAGMQELCWTLVSLPTQRAPHRRFRRNSQSSWRLGRLHQQGPCDHRGWLALGHKLGHLKE